MTTTTATRVSVIRELPTSIALPEALRRDVAGYELARPSLGEAAETYRLTARGRPTRYLKIAKELEREHARLRWAVRPTGLLDLGRLGVADRYQDIALASRDSKATSAPGGASRSPGPAGA